MAARSNPEEMLARALHQRTRRHFFADCGVGLGATALSSLLAGDRPALAAAKRPAEQPGKADKAAVAVAIRSRRGRAIILPGQRA